MTSYAIHPDWAEPFVYTASAPGRLVYVDTETWADTDPTPGIPPHRAFYEVERQDGALTFLKPEPLHRCPRRP